MSAVTYEDAARFGPFDPGAVVAASFVCPTCLGLPDDVVLDGDVLPEATCRCTTCDATYMVYLDDGQAMRLALAPPAELPRPTLR